MLRKWIQDETASGSFYKDDGAKLKIHVEEQMQAEIMRLTPFKEMPRVRAHKLLLTKLSDVSIFPDSSNTDGEMRPCPHILVKNQAFCKGVNTAVDKAEWSGWKIMARTNKRWVVVVALRRK